MKINTGRRACPKCGGQDFEHASCKQGREQLDGYTLHCLNCDWQGFKLQLVKIINSKTEGETK